MLHSHSPLVVEWADRMVFHIEYGSHRHKKFVHSFWLKPEWNQNVFTMGVKFNLRTLRRSNAPAEENALFVNKNSKTSSRLAMVTMGVVKLALKSNYIPGV